MEISPIGLALIKESEGFRASAYPDPGTGGSPWTIGFGHTRGVSPGDVCNEAAAEQWLKDDLQDAYAVLNKWVTVPVTQGQWDALCSFIFNVGPGAPGYRDGFVWLRSGNHSTMFRLLMQQDYAGAANEFPKWNLPPLPGLVIRRRRERELFLTGQWT